MKNVTPRELVKMLQEIPEEHQDTPIKICGGMSAECDLTANIITAMYNVRDERNPFIWLKEDW